MKKLIKKIDKSLPYWVEHILIGLLIHFGIFLLTGSLIFGAVVGASFYFFRELWQYFVQGKTHNGKYDHVGWIAPFVAIVIVTLILKI